MTKDNEGPIKPGELIGRIVPDPENPDVQRIRGFRLGESDRAGYWRLYLDADLSDYLEFKKESVLDGKEFPDGSTMVWLKPDARITRTRTQKAALQFLAGDIGSGFLRATAFALARAAGGGAGAGNEGTGTGTLNPTVCCLTVRRLGGDGGISPV
jgi:hypothetical protein